MAGERGELSMRPVMPPWWTLILGPHWLITIGEPPLILATCTNVDVAQHIHDLLVDHGAIDVEAFIATIEGPT